MSVVLVASFDFPRLMTSRSLGDDVYGQVSHKQIKGAGRIRCESEAAQACFDSCDGAGEADPPWLQSRMASGIEHNRPDYIVGDEAD